MENPPLRKLTVSIENENKEDVVIIFTEPSLKVSRCCILLLFSMRNYPYLGYLLVTRNQ